jgi:hypothetical protein
VALELQRHGVRRTVLALDAQVQGLDAAADQERGVGVEHAAQHAARFPQQRNQVLRARHHPAEHIVVPRQVLGGAVHAQVDAVLQGAAVHGRREGRVHERAGAPVTAHDRRHGVEIDAM